MAFDLRRLRAADAGRYRDLRLEALRTHPQSFGASWEIEQQEPLAFFADRLEGTVTMGGWRGDALLGSAGLRPFPTPKERHKAYVWGVYVRPAARGTGLGAALIERVIAEARGVVQELRLTVEAGNDAAIRLYTEAGFTAYGTEPRALKVGNAYFDETHMALRLE